MANANAPFGLRPVRGAYSQPYSDAATVYSAAAADATVIRYGDPVTVTGAARADGTAIVTRSTAGTGNAITGVAVGFRPYGATEWLGYRPASTDYEVLVEDNPLIEFEMMEDSDGGALSVDQAGANVSIIFGTATGNRSAAMIDSSTVGTTVGLQLRLLGLAKRVDNEPGVNAVWRVRLNNVTTTPNGASTGI
ncbi:MULTISPECIES: hypothetical protein [unclassified Sphingomonas]|uniref:hypothetical protein n=1 Tax=unclassified Sphingomonas TaxID=196159 RepID=UPI0006F8514D|nr:MULTISPECIES: hypothetical protein [unclassified Sphingomonas]KQM58785.1 hypothetical protein ASE65_10500 [Sphingomonas sp. Leaf16]KQN11040.1 hypothetical protein ASE81_11485 [Sphingomonas sp. Leaf29]KQN18342.1 hypothetical protein ASE83_11425 [Sphingomonas sp. Leaf32]